MKRNIVFVAVCIVLIGFAVGCSNLNPRREKSEFEITYAVELRAARSLLQDERSRLVFDNQVAIYAIPNFWELTLPLSGLRIENADFLRYIHPLIPINKGDTVIEGGSYVGHFSMKFSKKVGSNGRVIVFEPAPSAFKANLKTFKKHEIENVKVYPLALWSKNGTMAFYLKDSSELSGTLFGTNVSAFVEVETITIDYFVKTHNIQRVDFIKLQIEGAEMEALFGSENVLRRDKPNLAISIYHNPRHLFEIILWLNSLEIDYKFWMDRHDGYAWQKLNLYAMSVLRN